MVSYDVGGAHKGQVTQAVQEVAGVWISSTHVRKPLEDLEQRGDENQCMFLKDCWGCCLVSRL